MSVASCSGSFVVDLLAGRQFFPTRWLRAPSSVHFDLSVLKGCVVLGVQLEGGGEGKEYTPASYLSGNNTQSSLFHLWEWVAWPVLDCMKGWGLDSVTGQPLPGTILRYGRGSVCFHGQFCHGSFLVCPEPGFSDAVTPGALGCKHPCMLSSVTAMDVSFCLLLLILPTIWFFPWNLCIVGRACF